MICPRPPEITSAFVDGELSADDELTFRRHLDGCPRCTARVNDVQRLRAAVVRTTLDEPVPPRLAHGLRIAERRPWRPWARRVWPMAVAAAAVAVLALWRGAPDEPDGFTTALVADHIHYVHRPDRLQVSETDAGALGRWFAARLPFAPRLAGVRDARLVGGRLCTLRGNRLALAFADREGTPLSIFVGEAAALTPDARRAWEAASAAPCRDGLNGYRVCFDRQGPLVRAVVEPSRG